jgi:hypothetical protein
MSDSAGAASAGGSSDATPGAGTADTAASSQDRNTTSQQVSGQPHKLQTQQDRATQTQSQQKPAAEQLTQEELEEIALGSVKAKVPKNLAKAIKDFERGAQSRMSEAAQARKVAQSQERLLSLLNSDPDAFAAEYSRMTGKKFDFDEFAEERLARKYDLQQMTQEQRENLALKEKLQNIEKMDLAAKSGVINGIKELLGPDAPPNLEKYPKEELQRFLQNKMQVFEKTRQDLNDEVVNAWKETGLPKNKYFGSLMAYRMMSHQKRTGQPLQASEAARTVKGEFVSAVKEIVAQMDPQGIQDLLGADVMAKVRKADIDRVTGKSASNFGTQNRPDSQSVSEKKPTKPMDEYQYREYIRNMKV